IYEDEQGLNLEASLPGMDQKDIEVLVEDGVLTIKGQRKEEKTETGRDYLVREMASGEFSRSFTLPNYVDQDRAAASYRNGVLTIQFPKREEAKPRRVMIESK
ncbi:MAG: Hsp20/alpha crystallin family protein, partial [Nitrospirales bacterium]